MGVSEVPEEVRWWYTEDTGRDWPPARNTSFVSSETTETNEDIVDRESLISTMDNPVNMGQGGAAASSLATPSRDWQDPSGVVSFDTIAVAVRLTAEITFTVPRLFPRLSAGGIGELKSESPEVFSGVHLK